MFLSELLPAQLLEKVENFCPKSGKILTGYQPSQDDADDELISRLEASASAKIGPVKAEVKVRAERGQQPKAPTPALASGLPTVTRSSASKRSGRGRLTL